MEAVDILSLVERFNARIAEVVAQTRFASAAELASTLTEYVKGPYNLLLRLEPLPMPGLTRIPRWRLPRRLLPLVLLCGLHAGAQPVPETPGLGFEAARQLLLQRSDKLAAAQAATRSATLRADGLSGLGGPVLTSSPP